MTSGSDWTVCGSSLTMIAWFRMRVSRWSRRSLAGLGLRLSWDGSWIFVVIGQEQRTRAAR
jgi:hypothetical protein